MMVLCQLLPCGRGEIGRHSGLKELSARWETYGAELLKVGETLNGNPEPSPELGEGVETRRAAPKPPKGEMVKG